MEKEVMYSIYNALFDNKHVLSLENLEIYRNMEQQWVVSYEYEDENYIISIDNIGKAGKII